MKFRTFSQSQADAVAMVVRLGGRFERDAEADGKPVTKIDLTGAKVLDADLQALAGLEELRTLYLIGAKVTDAGLKELAGLKQLHNLYLNATKATNAGIDELKKALPNCQIAK
jgi:hypothetical protein